jgi:hypothetical protein
MRIPSGVTDQGFYFVAVDATDYVTRETGLSSFTIYRSRNGAAEVAMTTPTITEIDATNMPGVYFLTCDEDMTLDSGDHSQAMTYHITCSGMAPVTREIEIYRPDVTAGQTLNVSSGALNAISDGLLTAAKFGSDFITAAKVAADVGTEIASAVWSNATRLLTAGTNIVLAKGTGITGFNDLNAAGVRGAVGLASANLDTQLSTIDTVADGIKAVTDNLPNSGALTSIAQGADLATVDSNVDAIKAKTDNLPSDPADASIVAAATDAILAAVSDVPTNAELEARTLLAADYATASDLATVDTVADAIKAKTDQLSFGVTGKVDANITHVNEIAVSGEGTEANPWGPGA